MDREGKAQKKNPEISQSLSQKELAWRLLTKILYFFFLINAIMHCINTYDLNP